MHAPKNRKPNIKALIWLERLFLLFLISSFAALPFLGTRESFFFWIAYVIGGTAGYAYLTAAFGGNNRWGEEVMGIGILDPFFRFFRAKNKH
ncbi:hypothetical protein C4552_01275 [Candidatus Parcubacteria bacterium]|nr:MAG: hypothetical protein C4552_01275 [Candidatus Parcubacteria bacterium]